MSGQGLAAWCLIVAFAAPTVVAADAPRHPESPGLETRTPTPIEDDAQLHDVQFVSETVGWSVGDHGVIWHTRDGGESWALQSSGVDCPLHSVCFLTDRVGWAAGGGTIPFTHVSYGVVLHTTDGGQTWVPLVVPPASARTAGQKNVEPPSGSAARKNAAPASRSKVGPDRGNPQSPALPSVPSDEPGDADAESATSGKHRRAAKTIVPLPRLHRIKFFSLEAGVAAGAGTAAQPSGVFVTEDGGRTWRDLPGKPTAGWLAADFLNPDAGVVAGPRGTRGVLSEGRLLSPRVAAGGLRGIRDVTLQPRGRGWLVGDGGLVMRSDNAGRNWQPPAAMLPDGARDVFDFQAVACRGSKVWLAGQPGSVVWYSADGGKSWEKQSTGQPAPIAALHFVSDVRGWAVGAFGLVLRTGDGGRTWHDLRGGGRRLALMAVAGRTPQVPLALVAEQSAEAGYRSLVMLVARTDDESAARETTDLEARLSESVTRLGGSAAAICWQFPLAIPGLERDFERLFADWNRRTENRLDEVLTGYFVRQLRTWRPTVLVLEQGEKNDALTRLVNQAMLSAVEQAADATRFVEQQELARLEAWSVQKIFMRLPLGSTGQVHVDPHAYLPHVGQTVRLAVAPSAGILFDNDARSSRREAWRLLTDARATDRAAPAAGSFFAGLVIAPGSDARRLLSDLDDRDLAARAKLARRQRDFLAYTERNLHDSRHAGQLIAQMRETVQGMPDDQAALQLAELAEQYFRVGHWELGELALVELTEKFPAQPAAWRAMQQLIQIWSSGELAWRRMRPRSSSHERLRSEPTGAAIALAEAQARLEQQAHDVGEDGLINAADPTEPEIGRRKVITADVSGMTRAEWRDYDEKVRGLQTKAIRMARDLDSRAPALAAAPVVQFPLAAVLRDRSTPERAQSIYHKFLPHEVRTAWSGPAMAEGWLLNPAVPPQGSVAACVRTAAPPNLNGVFSEACWNGAAEIPLSTGPGTPLDSDSHPLVMLCHDGEHLYVAASLPRVPGTRIDGPAEKGRRYDEDISDFDRISFHFDVDRDYVTYYSFSVDQRGCTTESCWGDATWNVRWFVKVVADEDQWRVEAAIPLAELVPRAPGRGTVWNVGVVRTIPAVGLESWTHPASPTPRPETFGLLKFD